MMRTFEDFLASDLNPRRLSKEQRDVVYSDKATVVSAGAGSGKTTVLSYRYLRLLLLEDGSRRAGVEDILTLTFTRKAASEMYERIFRLIKMLAPCFPVLDREVRSFRKAHISTIDAFAAEIARTDCMRYGITRDFTILDNDERIRLIKDTATSLLADYGPQMAELSKIFNPVEMPSEVFLPLDERFDILSGFDAEDQQCMFSAFLDSLKKDVSGRLLQLLDMLAGSDPPSASSLPDFLDVNSDAYHAKLSRAIRDRDFRSLRPIGLRKGFVNTGARKEASDRIKSVVRRYNTLYPLLCSVEQLENDPGRAGYYGLFEVFLTRLGAEKRRLGALTFKDVEALALKILEENGRVRSYYKHRFKYIMIDEFQDNSLRQKDILYILSEKEEIDGRGVPPLEDLDDSKLFFVGDAKQSIYLFRGADVSVFNGLKKEISSIGGNVFSMGTNYRSEPGLIDHYNNVFNLVFPYEPERDGGDEEIEHLVEKELARYKGEDRYKAQAEKIGGREAKKDMASRIVFARSCKKDGDEGTDDLVWTENEAEYIVRKIREIVSSDEYQIPCQDGVRRPCFDDIAVLYRNSVSQIPLEKAFRRDGIPYTIVESTSITVEAMISDFYSFLTLVIQPRDKVCYFNVLRSPFARISDRGLLFFSAMKDRYELEEDCFSSVPEGLPEQDRERFASATSLYAEVRMMASRLPLEQVVSHLYYKGGYFSYLTANPELSSFEEHYEYIWETARRKKDLVKFLSYIRDVVQKRGRMDVNLLHLKSDGVRMMTIHKSKGLEFPVVFVCGITTAAVADRSILIDDPAVPFFAIDTSSGADVKRLIFSRYRSLREEAEMKRVLYVALTRASGHLFVIMSEKQRGTEKGNMAALYSKALAEWGCGYEEEVFDVLTEDQVSSSHIDIRVNSGFYSSPVAENTPCRPKNRGVKELSHENDEIYKDMPGAAALPPFEGRVDEILSSACCHDLFGTLCHQALECRFKGQPFSPAYDGRVTQDEMDELTSAAARVADSFFSSPYFHEVVEGKETASEVRFFSLSGPDIVVGSADLIVFEKDHNLVVDYKSDKYYDPDYHKKQLSSYAKAMETIYGRPCFCQVFYLRSMTPGPLWDAGKGLI